MAHGHVMQAACSVRGYSRSGAQLREESWKKGECACICMAPAQSHYPLHCYSRFCTPSAPSLSTIHCTVTLVSVPLVLHLSLLGRTCYIKLLIKLET
jgi:hypothetical protein